jgi:hypothetical protein
MTCFFLPLAVYFAFHIPRPTSFLTVKQTNCFRPCWNQHLSTIQESIDSSYLNPVPFWSKPQEKISNILICGDGDMSYAASIANHCFQLGISMTVSVLEDEITHNQVYEASKTNSELVCQYPHRIMFGVDATQLTHHFPSTLFDRIVFNFPHWKVSLGQNLTLPYLTACTLESTRYVMQPSYPLELCILGKS